MISSGPPTLEFVVDQLDPKRVLVTHLTDTAVYRLRHVSPAAEWRRAAQLRNAGYRVEGVH